MCPALLADHFRLALRRKHRDLPSLPADAKALSLAALATWLLHEDFFLAHPELAPAASDLFANGLQTLAQVTTAEQCVRDPDRREEFARHCLAQLSLRPRGESIAQAQDRYQSLDSVRTEHPEGCPRAPKSAPREVREKLAAEAARQAAARYNYE